MQTYIIDVHHFFGAVITIFPFSNDWVSKVAASKQHACNLTCPACKGSAISESGLLIKYPF